MTGTFTAKLTLIRGLVLGALGVLCAAPANAQVLLAEGQLIRSKAGSYADLSGLKGTLENGAAANLLGGLGSAITYVNGDTFLALPDRGPNAVSYNAALDDTVSYINRFHTIQMTLEPNNSGSGLPFTLTPVLRQTTLLHSLLPLAYGQGGAAAGGVGRGALRRTIFCGTTSRAVPTISIRTMTRASRSMRASTPRHSHLQRRPHRFHLR
jgi:hypothetical protein